MISLNFSVFFDLARCSHLLVQMNVCSNSSDHRSTVLDDFAPAAADLGHQWPVRIACRPQAINNEGDCTARQYGSFGYLVPRIRTSHFNTVKEQSH